MREIGFEQKGEREFKLDREARAEAGKRFPASKKVKWAR